MQEDRFKVKELIVQETLYRFADGEQAQTERTPSPIGIVLTVYPSYAGLKATKSSESLF